MLCNVTFRVAASLGPGETLHLLGDGAELGSWAASDAVALSTSPDAYPPLWFTAHPIPLPAGVATHYKYAVGAGGRLVRLEGFPGRRRLVPLPGAPELVVQDTLDAPPPAAEGGGARSGASASSGSALASSSSSSSSSTSPSPRKRVAFSDADSGAGAPVQHTDARVVAAAATATAPQPAAAVSTAALGEGERGWAAQEAALLGAPLGARRLPLLRRAGSNPTLAASAADGAAAAAGSSSASSSSSLRLGSSEGEGEAGAHGAAASTTPGGDGAAASVTPAAAASATAAPAASALADGDGVLIVQYQLPVRLWKGPPGAPPPPSSASAADTEAAASAPGAVWQAQWDEEALLAPKGPLESSRLARLRVTWIGTPPAPVPPADEEEVTRLLEPLRCIPVFLPPATQRAFYDGYCRDTLWPIFHNFEDVYGEVPTRWWVKERQSGRWKAYTDANQKFAATVVENFHEGDLVWVQDFPLLLVPMQLARRHIAPVGLFMHSPYPSSEIYRSLSMRDELLRGMLNADHLGFHLFEYARHFLTSCRRILGLTHVYKKRGGIAVEYQGREVAITVSHVGIEPDFLLEQFSEVPEITAMAAVWRAAFPGRAILGGIDTVERLKGVPLKLLAFEAFLERHPTYAGKVALVQYCVQEAGRPGDTQESSRAEIISLAARINSKWGSGSGGSSPAVQLVFRNDTVPLAERLALWTVCDVHLNTAIRDGLNLHPFEYCYARGSAECVPSGVAALGDALRDAPAGTPWGDLFPAAAGLAVSLGLPSAASAPFPSLAALQASLLSLSPGAIVLSEFSGAVRVLPGALRVNPWRLDELVSSIGHALTMSAEEVAARAASNLQYTRGNTTSCWAERVLSDLKAASARVGARSYQSFGLGLGYRLMGFGSSFKPLDVEEVVAAYKRASHRLIVCDYGGTLHCRDTSTSRKVVLELGLMGKDTATPLAPDTKRALRTLSEDPRNTVFVISGKERDVLQQAFASLPCVGLAAEHGFYYRWGAHPASVAAAAAGAGGGSSSSRSGGGLAGTGSGARSSAATSGLGTPRFPSSAALGGATPVFSPLGGSAASAGATPTPSSDGTSAASPLSLAAAVVGDNGQPWATLDPSFKVGEWIALGLSIMEAYATRTNGTFILRKGSAISWHYGDADPEFGGMQAKEMQDHLTGVLSGFPVDVLSGHDYVEVRPKGVNKGVVLSVILDVLEGNPPGTLARGMGGGSSGGVAAALSKAAAAAAAAGAGAGNGNGSPSLHSPVSPAAPSSSSSSSSSPRPAPLDFVLVLGDDLADEQMFLTVQAHKKARSAEDERRKARPALMTVTAGRAAFAAVAAAVAGSSSGENASAAAEGSAATTIAASSAKAPGAAAALTGALSSSSSLPPLPPLAAYTATVGKKPSAAAYFLDDTQQVEDVLRVLAKATLKMAWKAAAAATSVGAGVGAAGAGAASARGGAPPAALPAPAPAGGALHPSIAAAAPWFAYGAPQQAGAAAGAAADAARARMAAVAAGLSRLSLPAGLDALAAAAAAAAGGGSGGGAAGAAGAGALFAPWASSVALSRAGGGLAGTSPDLAALWAGGAGGAAAASAGVSASSLRPAGAPLVMSPSRSAAASGGVAATLAGAAAALPQSAASSASDIPAAAIAHVHTASDANGVHTRYGNVLPGTPGALAGLYAGSSSMLSSLVGTPLPGSAAGSAPGSVSGRLDASFSSMDSVERGGVGDEDDDGEDAPIAVGRVSLGGSARGGPIAAGAAGGAGGGSLRGLLAVNTAAGGAVPGALSPPRLVSPHAAAGSGPVAAGGVAPSASPTAAAAAAAAAAAVAAAAAAAGSFSSLASLGATATLTGFVGRSPSSLGIPALVRVPSAGAVVPAAAVALPGVDGVGDGEEDGEDAEEALEF